jgi:pyruvate dehydrogenase E2 component (dihydrolipoamide acetyltransferase)
VARVDIVMPQMGESIAEGTLSKWLKKVGDAVKRDEPIFEISTDKVDAEIPAPSSGTLAEILVTEGQTVPVSTVVARLETEVGAAVAATAPTKAEPANASPAKAEPAKAAAAQGSGRGNCNALLRVLCGSWPGWQRQFARGPSPHQVVAARAEDCG